MGYIVYTMIHQTIPFTVQLIELESLNGYIVLKRIQNRMQFWFKFTPLL